jgi:transposase InsO family protein
MTAAQPQGGLSIERLCGLARVSRAGYYRHVAASAPRREEMAVRDAIQRVALGNRRYGYRRVAQELRRQGMVANHKRVLRLMRADNLLCLRAKPFVPRTTDSRHGWVVVPNLARGMILTGLDQLWVADITYIRMAEEFAYLAIVLDAFSRRVVGWALETHLQASLALAALDMALEARRPPPGSLIHHSDRGVQYACADYAARLAAHHIRASMSRVANPYDNAPFDKLRVRSRELHENAEARGGRRHRLPRRRPRPPRDQPLHRGDLQSRAPTLRPGISPARRVRGGRAGDARHGTRHALVR